MADPEHKSNEREEQNVAEEEDTSAPIVTLEAVTVTTGEEDEVSLLDIIRVPLPTDEDEDTAMADPEQRREEENAAEDDYTIPPTDPCFRFDDYFRNLKAKKYRLKKAMNERGTGTVEEVRHRDTGQSKTFLDIHDEVALTIGEEDEDSLRDLKSKLYRFDKDGNRWKERGTGTVKFLKHRKTGKIRLLMRQSKTLKICANHLIVSGMKVHEHPGNDKCCVWHASDYADGDLKHEMFCIRLTSLDDTRRFIKMFKDGWC